MLFYGSFKCTNIPQNTIVYNLTSLNESLPRLRLLVPPGNVGYLDSRDFDIAYMNYIFNNNNVFIEFFQIIYNLYMGNDVYITIIDGIDWSENLIESLLKLIQQRYGYNAYRIEYYADYQEAIKHHSDFDPGYGLMNLDMDKQRYTMLLAPSYQPQNNNYQQYPQIIDDDTPPWN